MKRKPIALQLYTVREALETDLRGTLERVAAIGYAGVEPAGFPGTTAAGMARMCRDLNLAIPSAHMPLPVGDERERVLDDMAALGCARLVSGWLPPDHYRDADAIRRTADLFNEAHAAAVTRGLALGIHNHWWEFEPVGGRLAYEILLERLDPAIFLEIDTYWIRVAGADPAQVLADLGPRAPLLHLKDGPGDRERPMVALGQGIMDFPPVMRAAGEHAEWFIVELDRCATDMMAAVAESYAYLTARGWGYGQS